MGGPTAFGVGRMKSIAQISRSLRLISSRDRRVLAVAALAQSLLAFLDLLAIVILGVISAQALGSGNRSVQILGQTISLEFPKEDLIWLAIAAGILLIVKSATSLLISKRIYSFIANRQAIVASGLAERLLRQPLLEISRRTSQETIYALSTGVMAATVGTLGPATSLMAELALTIVLLVGLLAVDPLIAVFALVFFGLIAAVLQVALGRWAFTLGKQASEAEIDSTSTIQHVLRAYREVSVAGKRGFFVKRFAEHRWAAARTQANWYVLTQISKYTFEIGLVLGGGLLILVISLSRGLSEGVASLTVFLLVAARVFPALLRTQVNLSNIRTAAGNAQPTFRLAKEIGAAERAASVEHVLAQQDETSLKRTAYPYADFEPSVDVSGVSLIYPGASRPALRKVSLRVMPGTSVALVGSSGAGKTSLVDVLLGIIRPTEGSVMVSGIPPEHAIAKWTGAISYVPQDVALLTGTVRENVAIGEARSVVDDDRVWDCLQQVRLSEFFREQRAGLETQVGEHGVRLSGGQRQRLGLARALYTRPKLLVLDEATSALDAATEAGITDALSRLEGRVSLIIVAHRLSTVRGCDRVVYLDEGSVVGMGSFEEVRQVVPDFDVQADLMGL